MLFGYETKYLTRQVQRNINRFSENYCFQLSENEYKNLRCQNVTSSSKSSYGGRRYFSYVFTEYGITILAGLLKSDIAVAASLRIVNTFIAMKKYISNHLLVSIIIDDKVLYHCGASFKDLGKKCFGINRIDNMDMINDIKSKL